MSGYVYRGSGVDELTPDVDDTDLPSAGPRSPAEGSTTVRMTNVGFTLIADRVRRLTSCDAGAHLAFTTTDRTGIWFWACRRCPAYREQRTDGWVRPWH